jgi:catechol 2,3-dioxygenase-like lactoylglutathione lyase family enzyme
VIRGYRFTIFASDLARSRHFYEEQLGCRVDNVTDLGFTAHRDELEFVVEGGAKRRKLGKAWLGEAGLYITAGARVSLLDETGTLQRVVPARELSGGSDLLFRRNSQSGAIECLSNRAAIALNAALHAND